MSLFWIGVCRWTEFGRAGSDVSSIFIFCLLAALDFGIMFRIVKGY